MSESKRGRSAKVKEDPDASATKAAKTAPALRKIFYISHRMLEDDLTYKLKLERFFHPGKGKKTLFITRDDKQIMEILEYTEPRRSWLINSEVCSNGHIYLTTPMDVTFLALHQLRKHCFKNALALDSIHEDDDPTVARVLQNFVDPNSLKCIADVKSSGDMTFYKYNHDKAMAWLSLKTKRIADYLRKSGIYCGLSAVSQNFARSEKYVDETAQDTDYLRMACDYVGGYVSLDLHDELTKYLKIPSEIQAITDEKKSSTKKRKSGDKLNNDAGTKKQKLLNGAASKLKKSKLIDESLDEDVGEDDDKDEEEENKNNSSIKDASFKSSPPAIVATPLKERTLSAKEKSLAKSAKGTKSISSFFTKK